MAIYDVSEWDDDTVEDAMELMSIPGAVGEAEFNELEGKINQYAHGKEVQQFDNLIDNSPKQAPTMRGEGMGQRGPRVKPGERAFMPDATHATAAESGIDVYTGAPAEWRRGVSELKGNKGKKMYLQYEVDKALDAAGVTVPNNVDTVFTDDATGKLGYMRATGEGTLVPTLLDEYGVELGDVAEAWPSARSFAIEEGATALGAVPGVLTASPAGIAAGAAVGAGAGNYAANSYRRAAAAKLINDRYPNDPEAARIIQTINSDKQVDEALTSLGLAGALPALGATVRWARNLGRPIDFADDAPGNASRQEFYDHLTRSSDEYNSAIAESEVAVRRYNEVAERVGARQIEPSLGDMTNNVAVQIEEQTAKGRLFGKMGRGVIGREVNNARSIGDTLQRLSTTEAPSSRELSDVLMGVADTTDDARAIVQGPMRRAADDVTNTTRTLQSSIDDASDQYDRDVFTRTQQELFANRDASSRNLRQQWDNLNNLVGYNPETKQARVMLDNRDGQSRIKALLGDLDKDSQNRLLVAHKQAEQKFVKDMGLDPDAMDESQLSLMDDYLDLNQLHYTLSNLKQQMRSDELAQATGNGSKVQWAPGRLKQVVDALEKQVRVDRKFVNATDAAGSPIDAVNRNNMGAAKSNNIADTWIEAHEATAKHHDVMNSGVIKSLVARDADGAFTMKPGEVRRVLLNPNSPEAMHVALRATGNDPKLKDMLGEQLLVKWKEMVEPGGKVSMAGLSKFKRDYDDHLVALFGKSGSDKVDNAYELGAQLRKNKAKADAYERATVAAFGKKLSGDTYHGDVVNMSFSPAAGLTPKQIRKFKDRVGKIDPVLLADVKTQGMEKIKNELMEAGDNYGNLAQLEKLLADGNKTGKIGAWFTPQYVKDLGSVRDAARILESSKGVKAVPIEHQPMFLHITRSFIGPMSPWQRKLTAGNRYAQSRMKKRTADVLSDPSLVRHLVRIKNTPTKAAQAAFYGAVVRQLGPDTLLPEEQQFLTRYHQEVAASRPRGY